MLNIISSPEYIFDWQNMWRQLTNAHKHAKTNQRRAAWTVVEKKLGFIIKILNKCKILPVSGGVLTSRIGDNGSRSSITRSGTDDGEAASGASSRLRGATDARKRKGEPGSPFRANASFARKRASSTSNVKALSPLKIAIKNIIVRKIRNKITSLSFLEF
jgi:hypothetical protein